MQSLKGRKASRKRKVFEPVEPVDGPPAYRAKRPKEEPRDPEDSKEPPPAYHAEPTSGRQDIDDLHKLQAMLTGLQNKASGADQSFFRRLNKKVSKMQQTKEQIDDLCRLKALIRELRSAAPEVRKPFLHNVWVAVSLQIDVLGGPKEPEESLEKQKLKALPPPGPRCPGLQPIPEEAQAEIDDLRLFRTECDDLQANATNVQKPFLQGLSERVGYHTELHVMHWLCQNKMECCR